MTTYLQRALQAAHSARELQKNGDYDGTCNRAYYAVFYAALGLFEMSGDETAGKTHRSILRRFSERFVLSGEAAPEVGRAFTVAQSLRSTADYSAKGASAGDAVEAIAAMKVILEFAGPLLDPAADHKD